MAGSQFLTHLCCLLICLLGAHASFYVPSNRSSAPEDELCSWLIDRCPYLKTLYGRPVEDPTEAVQITMAKFQARRFLGISDLEERMTMQAILNIQWKMPQCAVWNAQSLANEAALSESARKVTNCLFPKDNIWHPAIRLSNAFDDTTIIETLASAVNVLNTGIAVFQAPGKYSTVCNLQLQNFPFDQQNCFVEIFTAIPRNLVYYPPSAVRIELMENIWPENQFISDVDIWRLVGLDHKLLYVASTNATILQFHFILDRKQEYYMWSIFLTIELLMALQVSSMVMHPSDSNRAAYAITVILGFSISLSLVTDNIPKTSQTVYLIYYVSFYMVLGAVITIYTVFTCAHSDSKDSPLSKNITMTICGKQRKVMLARLLDVVFTVVVVLMLLIVNVAYISLAKST